MSNEEKIMCIDKIKNIDPYQRDSSGQIAGITDLMWEPGTKLTIKFLGGDPQVVNKVKEKFNLWLNHATTLKFEYVDNGNADIRIGFQEGDGHWSYLGKEIRNINPNERTMNLGWSHDTQIPDEEIERVAVHELGHSLGLIHEQSQPKAKLDWDEDKVYEYFERTQGWDRETTFHNVLERYSEQITQYSNYDPTSIMHYGIPGFLLRSGQGITGGNKLSETDKEFAKKHWGNK